MKHVRTRQDKELPRTLRTRLWRYRSRRLGLHTLPSRAICFGIFRVAALAPTFIVQTSLSATAWSYRHSFAPRFFDHVEQQADRQLGHCSRLLRDQSERRLRHARAASRTLTGTAFRCSAPWAPRTSSTRSTVRSRLCPACTRSRREKVQEHP